MDGLLNSLLCNVTVILLLGSLLIVLTRRSGTRSSAGKPDPSAQGQPGPSGDLSLEHYAAFDQLLAAWGREGRLPAAVADQVRDILADHVTAAMPRPSDPAGAPAPSRARPLPDAPSAPTHPSAAAPALPPSSAPTLAPSGTIPAPASEILGGAAALAPSGLQPTAAAAVLGGAAALAPSNLPPTASLPAGPAARSPQPAALLSSLGAALLALDTRRILLYLGSFLLVMSSLTLVIFNWSSLPALVQLAILAGTTAAIWAGGAWMGRRPDLAAAGSNLQAVAALLMPVVGFALGRPGLLDLAPRPAWLLASVVSLLAYLVAAWRTGRSFYSGAAAVAALSALLAALGGVAAGWHPPAALLLLATLLPLSRALRASAMPGLAAGPRWVALIGAALVGVVAGALALSGMASTAAVAATLGAGAVFCGLAYGAERHRAWLWVSLGLAPAAALVALSAADVEAAWLGLSLSLFALGYFLLSEPAAAHHRSSAPPLLVLGLAMGGLTLAWSVLGADIARLALPPLILLGAAAFTMAEAGRLQWTGAGRLGLAAGGLGAAGLLFVAWLALQLDTAGIPHGTIGLALLPLAGAAFAAARWWPGSRQRAYDLALQLVASLVTLAAGGAALLDTDAQLPGALLLTLILGGQAAMRRAWPWATLSLGCGALAAVFAVERLAPTDDLLRAATITALGTSAIYTLAGAQLRRSGLRYWTWPAIAWGALAGLSALGLAVLQIVTAPGVAAGVLLGLAALLGAHTALWRRPEPGYGAAPLLALATCIAAAEGFFLGWATAPGDLAYTLCGIVLGLALIGQALRRFGLAYARPYELLAFVLLPAAPLLALGSVAHLALTWALMAALYGAALWRYRIPWMLAPAFVAADLALLHGAGWLWPGGEPASAGLLIAAAVWLQSLGSAWLRRRPPPYGPAARWGYAGAAIGGALALALTLGSSGHGAVVALAFAALLALLTWIEQQEQNAWAGLALLALGLGLAHDAVGVELPWSLLLGSLEALLVLMLGWAVTALAAGRPRLLPFRRPLEHGAAAAAITLPAILVGESLLGAPAFAAAALLLLGLAVGLLGWRRRLPILAAPTLVLWSLAVVAHGVLVRPEVWSALDSSLLLALAWAQGAGAILVGVRHRWSGAKLAGAAAPNTPAASVSAAGAVPGGAGWRRLAPASTLGAILVTAIYAASIATGALALLAGLGNSLELAIVAGGLAALWTLAASIERSEAAAWGAFGLLVTALACAGDAAGIPAAWISGWIVLVQVGVCLAGWLLTWGGLVVWRRPSTFGPLGLALVSVPLALLLGGELPPFTFALASLGLLLVTVAVRERELRYAYAAGAAFVAAALSQLADWGVAELQWYVLPAGLYLLALAFGLRRFQGRRRASQLVEAAGLMLLLGVTFGQAIRPEGGLPYSLLLFAESLALVAYGALARLRVPFLGGAAFFVAGVTWMTVDSVRLANQWVLLGAVGLLMVAAYVVLERHQERLLRAGRYWAGQLRSWG